MLNGAQKNVNDKPDLDDGHLCLKCLFAAHVILCDLSIQKIGVVVVKNFKVGATHVEIWSTAT